mgnify:FL=1
MKKVWGKDCGRFITVWFSCYSFGFSNCSITGSIQSTSCDRLMREVCAILCFIGLSSYCLSLTVKCPQSYYALSSTFPSVFSLYHSTLALPSFHLSLHCSDTQTIRTGWDVLRNKFENYINKSVLLKSNDLVLVDIKDLKQFLNVFAFRRYDFAR